MSKIRLIIYITFLLTPFFSFGQPLEEFNMKDTTVTVCKGILLDSDEGSGDTYLSNEDFTFVINTGGTIILSFDQLNFELESGEFDTIAFYDGPTVNPANLIFKHWEYDVAPPTVTANSGYLTIHFKSDLSVNGLGWVAQWRTIVAPPVPPVISLSTAPSCNASDIELQFDKNVGLNQLNPGVFELMGGNQTFSITNTTPIGGTVDSTQGVRLQLDNPLNYNCNYQVSFDIDLPDRCDSLWSFTVSHNFDFRGCPLDAIIQADFDTVCPGSPVTLEAIPNGCFTYNYNWSPNVNTTAGPLTVFPLATTTYQVTVDDPVSGESFIATKTIEVVNVQIDASNPDTVCQSEPLFNLTALPAGGTWSGLPIIDDVLGTFFADTALPGMNQILYSISGACADTLNIYVKPIDAWIDEAACPGSPAFIIPDFTPPGGVWSGGPYVNASGLFTPPVTPGVYPVTYSINGCSETKDIYVDNLNGPATTDSVCESEAPYIIPVTPPGGRWYGDGIIDSLTGLFDPDDADEGQLNDLYYVLQGCSYNYKVFVKEIHTRNAITACAKQGTIQIDANQRPTGGVWTGGPSLVAPDSINTMYAGGSNFEDTFLYTLPNGCQDTTDLYVRWTDIGYDTMRFCIDDDALELTFDNVGRTPWGGTWIGDGYYEWNNDDYFVPSFEGAGLDTLVYSANTCNDTAIVIVYPDIPLTDSLLCSTQDPFLVYDVPLGSRFYLNGVQLDSGYLHPQTLGAGFHDVIYATPVGCLDTITFEVYDFVPASITGIDSQDYCWVDEDIQVSYAPPLGTLQGSGLIGDTVFNAAVMGAVQTNYTFIYSFGLNSCFTSDTVELNILPELTGQISATKDTICGGGGTQISIELSGGLPGAIPTYDWLPDNYQFGQRVVVPDSTTTYTVTVTDGCSDTLILQKQIAIFDGFTVDARTSGNQCYGDPGFAAADLIGQYPGRFYWDNESYSNDALLYSDSLPTIAGESFILHVIDSNGCEWDSLIKIPSYTVVTANFSSNPEEECIDFDDNPITLIDLSFNALTGYWIIGTDTLPYQVGYNLDYEFPKPELYPVTLYVENEGGCADSTYREICMNVPELIFVPDIFSPNGDGRNDILYARSSGLKEIYFAVYNRWGEKVFETEDSDIGWDGRFRGKEMNTGVFVYYLKGVNLNNEVVELKGDVSLVK